VDGKAVLVRSARYGAPLTIMLIGFGLLGTNTFWQAWLHSTDSLVLGAFCILVSGYWWKIELDRRIWVEVMPTNFRLYDRTTEHTVDEHRIVSFAIFQQHHFSCGLLKSVTRTIKLHKAPLAQGFVNVTMTNTVGVGKVDPLAGLITRICDRLLERARQDLRCGLLVQGEGWSLDQATLHVMASGQEGIDIHTTDITRLKLVDQNVCCWVNGYDEPVAKVPIKAANAWLLLQLLGEQLQLRVPTAREPNEGELGHLIFERRPSHIRLVAVILLAYLLGLVSLSMFVALIFAFAESRSVFVGIFVVVNVSVCVAWSYLLRQFDSRSPFYRFHEYGVHKRGLFGEKKLQYQEVASFTYKAVRCFVNGVYTGTIFTLVIDPLPQHKSKRISYSVMLQNPDDELDNIRNHIARILANRMLLQFQQGQPIRWAEHLRFIPQGLEYRPKGWIARKSVQVIPYNQIHCYIDQGILYIQDLKICKFVIQECTSARNFFPGLIMLGLLVNCSVKMRSDKT